MPDPRTLATRCCIAGGGPAGMMLGLLLARAGVEVLVLEKHADFLRDFRGDTVHPSTLEVMHELGLLSAFLQRPHDEVRELHAMVGETEMVIADFSRLRTHCRFIALMPQWEFLDFLRQQAERYPSFRLLQRADVTGVIEHAGRVTGVQAQTPEGLMHVQADLVIGADGRHSTVRAAAALAVRDIGAPIDVLWLRLPRLPDDPSVTGGRINTGSFLVMLDRGSYWQCAYVIAKGGIEAVQARGLDAFRAALVRVAPLLADRVHLLASWDDIKLLSVTVDRLERWWKPGLLCIGDAAHAMSPVGGVGINLAVQDAVATANALAAALADRDLGADALTPLLERVERRRLFPVRVTQAMQVAVQNRVLGAVVDPARTAPMKLPWPMRLFMWFPLLRGVPAWLVGVGVRPEHVPIMGPMSTPQTSTSADARPSRPRPTPRRIEVLEIQPLSPHMARITFGGADLAGFEWRGPAGHLKLTVPDDGQHEAPMPQEDGPRSALMRTYTPRGFDAKALTLDVDFVLHAHGPAGRWASRAQVGDRLVLMGPAPGYRIDTGADWFVLAGDDTALPAIETILAELPARARALVFVEVVDGGEARELRSPARVDVQWVVRPGEPAPPGQALDAALRALPALPPGPGRIYVGCESTAMRRIRDFWVKERGVQVRNVVARGYWKQGNPNHPDRDYADEPAR